MSGLITVRASSLSELFDCPARFEAKHIKGLRRPRSAAAQLGTAIHASTAVYDESRMTGQGITADEAAGALVDAIHKPAEDVDWEEDSPKTAEKIGLALHRLYCDEIAPVQDYRGVEVTCERLEITDLGIALTGTTDRVRVTPDGLGIADLKTGKTAVGADGAVATKGHAIQAAVYELLASAAMGLPITAPAQIIGMQTGKTAKGQRVGTGEIASARNILLGDDEAPGLLEYASKILKSGDFYGNPGSRLCSEKFCPAFGICRFRA